MSDILSIMVGQSSIRLEEQFSLLREALQNEKFATFHPIILKSLTLMERFENSAGEDVLRLFAQTGVLARAIKDGDVNSMSSLEVTEPQKWVDIDEGGKDDKAHNSFSEDAPKVQIKRETPFDWADMEDCGEGLVNANREWLWTKKEEGSVEIQNMVLVDETVAVFRLLPALMPKYLFTLWNRGFTVSKHSLLKYGLMEGIEPRIVLVDGVAARLMLETIAFRNGNTGSDFYRYDESTGIHQFITPGYQVKLDWYTDRDRFENHWLPMARAPHPVSSTNQA